MDRTSAREPTACPGGPPSRAQDCGDGAEVKPLALPTPEWGVRADAMREAMEDARYRRFLKNREHERRMKTEADADWYGHLKNPNAMKEG